jgi:hypothetical protein
MGKTTEITGPVIMVMLEVTGKITAIGPEPEAAITGVSKTRAGRALLRLC